MWNRPSHNTFSENTQELVLGCAKVEIAPDFRACVIPVLLDRNEPNQLASVGIT